ncbi:unnamed protein product [Rotaria magnacalcarata]|uniref:Transposase n=1 Tax=Rotaria magnacalcarata TaxID=392030 RepID=A0A816MN70_9BILA|nr:unnamed protein product [Rotaria magnacalcarata]CAF2058769.1 unnamed protein product [Rotaria magnacalcarata]
MASVSTQGLRQSQRNSSSIVQVIQIDQSSSGRQSRKKSKNSSASGVKNGEKQSSSSTQQRATSNLGGNIIAVGEDEDENADKYIDQLNISSTSTATEIMEVSQQQDDDEDPSASAIEDNNQSRRTVHKQATYSEANLRSHLARQHKLTHVLYPSQRLQNQVKPQALSSGLKKTLDNDLIYSIIKDSRPFGDFRKAGFQHFLQVVLPDTNYKDPHRITVKKRMEALYSFYSKVLIEEFSSLSDIALTADSWSSPCRAHFILISFRRFIGRGFVVRIRQFIRSELKKLKISDKICSITTDNGANIKLAANVKEFGIHIPCLAHGIHLTAVNGLGL